MAYGLPARGQRDWDDELNNSVESLRGDVQSAVADAASAKSNATTAITSADAAKAQAALSAQSAATAAAAASAPADEAVEAVLSNPDSASSAVLSATYGPRDTLRPLSQQIEFTKYAGNPLFDTDDTTDFSTILWPWVLRVDTLLATPLGTYYMWFSTDHAGAGGKVGLAYADSLTGPWTIHGVVYQDTSSGTETETPSVVWDYDTGELVMFYQQISATGANASQATLYATSPDGVTWTRQGIALDVYNANLFPAPAHTGYFRPFRVGDQWIGYSLLTGTTGSRFAISYSADGRTWELDPRPLGFGAEWLGYGWRIEWNTSNVVLWRGQWMWIGIVNDFASGTATRDGYYAIAPLSADFRNLAGPPKKLFGITQAWETDFFNQCHVFVDEGTLWMIYRSGDNDATTKFAFGAAATGGAA